MSKSTIIKIFTELDFTIIIRIMSTTKQIIINALTNISSGRYNILLKWMKTVWKAINASNHIIFYCVIKALPFVQPFEARIYEIKIK